MSAINPATAQAVLQLTRLGVETAEKLNDGQMTDEEFRRKLQEMQANLDSANARWETAADQSGEGSR